MSARCLVSVVDDDESVRESLPALLGELGYAARAFASAEEFLASPFVDRTRCLVLDVGMPGMSGPELRDELAHRRRPIPIIFITAHGSPPAGNPDAEASVVACLFKPFSESELRGALFAALA